MIDFSKYPDIEDDKVYECTITKERATKVFYLYSWQYYFIVISFQKVSIPISINGIRIQETSRSFFWKIMTPLLYKVSQVPVIGAGLILIVLFYGSVIFLLLALIIDKKNGVKFLSRGILVLKSNKLYIEGNLAENFDIKTCYWEHSGPGGF